MCCVCHGRMTTETAEQPRREDSDHEQSLKADSEQPTHAQLDDANSATDSDADDSGPEPDDQDAALQQAHSEVPYEYIVACCLSTLQLGDRCSLLLQYWYLPFSALMLLVGWQESTWPVKKQR